MTSKTNNNTYYNVHNIYYNDPSFKGEPGVNRSISKFVYYNDPSDNIEYVVPNPAISKDTKRPVHIKTIPGLYDELDYELSPRAASNKPSVTYNKKTIGTLFILATCMMVAIVVVVVIFWKGMIL